MNTATKYQTDADLLRADLKQAGYNRKMVSVRYPHSCLDVTVYDPDIKLDTIRDIALKYEKIDYCQASGEILSGGNTFVTVEYSDKAREILINRAMPAVNTALERLASDPGGSSLESCLGGLIGYDRGYNNRYTVRNANEKHSIAFDAEGIACHLMGC